MSAILALCSNFALFCPSFSRARGWRIPENNVITEVEELVGMSEHDLLRLRGLDSTKLDNHKQLLHQRDILPKGSNLPLSKVDYLVWSE